MSAKFNMKLFLYRTFAVLMIAMLALVAMPIVTAYAATCTATTTGDWSTPGTWSGCGVGVPGSSDDVVINAGITVTVTANAAANKIDFAATGVGTPILTVNNGVVLNVTNGITVRNSAFQIRSATISGGGTINAASVTVGGTNTVLSNDATTTLTSTISNLSISGNLTIDGVHVASDENDAVFNLESGAVSVAGTVVLDSEDDGSVGSGDATLNLNTGIGSGTLTLSGATPFTDTGTGGTRTFVANGTSATVAYSGTAQTVRAVTYTNLTLSDSGAKTLTGVSTVNGNLILSGTATAATGAATTIGGNLSVGDGTTFTAAGFSLTVTGTTTVGGGTSGNLTVSSISGTKIFIGLVTVNSGATWNNSVNENLTFRGGITNNGTFNAGTGTHNFDTNSQALTGTLSIPNIVISSGGVTLTNNNTLTVGTALSGTGSLTQAASSTLNIGGISTINSLIATALGNTVNYTGGAQAVKATTYRNLIFSGTGLKSMASGTSASGDLSIAPTGTAKASVGDTLNLTVNSLTLGGIGTNFGTWGSTASPATNQNNTYFDSLTTGILTTATDTRSTQVTLTVVDPSPVVYNSTPTLSTTGGSGTGAITFSVGASTGCSVAGSTLSVIDISLPCAVTATKAADSNYNVATSPAVTVTLTAKELTITGVTASNKVYDGNTTATLTGTAALSGVVGSDVVTLDGTPAATFVTATVANGKPVTVSGYTISGADAGNYTLTQPTGLTANITAKTLTITGLTANDKTFDGNTAATLSGTAALSGVVGVDVVTLGGTPVASFADAAVGNAKPVTVTGYTISGADAGNYSLTQPGGLTANITAKLIPTVTATGGPFTYDGASHAATVNGSVAGTVSNVRYNGSATVPTNVGTYTVTADFTPDDTATYENLTNAVAGSITINKVALTVTANNQSIIAGSADPAFTFAYSGFANSENSGVIDTAPACSVSVAHSLPGLYTIVCSGGVDNNYSFSYVNGTLTVNAANNPPTDISLSNSSINENQAANTVVGSLSTIDPDAGDTFTYSFCGGTDDASFALSGNSLQSAVIFDFEAKSSYSVCIRSTDGGTLNTTKTFAISINNLVDTQTFTDVAPSYWAYSYIERLYAAGITGGCATSPSLIYCPDSTVTRAQMAIFLLRGIHGSSYIPPAIGSGSGFTDVPAGSFADTWIKELALEGITSGCGAGIYCPESTVTRAQMAVFLLRGRHGSSYTPPAVGSGTGFSDVPAGSFADAWIKQLAAEGITSGCTATTYCPGGSVTRAEMAIFLVRTFNLP